MRARAAVARVVWDTTCVHTVVLGQAAVVPDGNVRRLSFSFAEAVSAEDKFYQQCFLLQIAPE